MGTFYSFWKLLLTKLQPATVHGPVEEPKLHYNDVEEVEPGTFLVLVKVPNGIKSLFKRYVKERKEHDPDWPTASVFFGTMDSPTEFEQWLSSIERNNRYN